LKETVSSLKQEESLVDRYGLELLKTAF